MNRIEREPVPYSGNLIDTLRDIVEGALAPYRSVTVLGLADRFCENCDQLESRHASAGAVCPIRDLTKTQPITTFSPVRVRGNSAAVQGDGAAGQSRGVDAAQTLPQGAPLLEVSYRKFCIEHELELNPDGSCPKCRDSNGQPFILDLQGIYLESFCEYCANEGQIARNSGTAETVECPECKGKRVL